MQLEEINKAIEDYKNNLKNSLSVSELLSIVNEQITVSENSTIFILNELKNFNNTITIDEFKNELSILFNEFYFFTKLDRKDFNFLYFEITQKKILVTEILNLQTALNSLRLFLEIHSPKFNELIHLIYLVKNLNMIRSNLAKIEIREQKKFITENINNILPKNIFEDNIPTALFSLQLSSNGSFELKKHSIKINRSHSFNKKRNYLENILSYEENTEYMTELQIDSILEKELTKKFNLTHNINHFNDRKNYDEHIRFLVDKEIKRLNKFISDKDITRFTINNKTYNSFNDIKDLKFLMVDNIPITSEKDANNFIKKPLYEIYEMVSLKYNLNNF